MLQSLYSILTNLFVVQVQAAQVIIVTVVLKSRSFILRRRCCQDLREQSLLLLQYRKARCGDLKAQGLHQRRHCDTFIGTLPGMFIGTLPGMFIGTLPGMISSGRCPACSSGRSPACWF